MNASILLLFALDEFITLLKQWMNDKDLHSNVNLTLCLSLFSLYHYLSTGKNSGDVTDIKDKINAFADKDFDHYETHDAHNFLISLLDVLKEQTKSPVIDDFFVHITYSKKKMW